jgi:hypothetical protein
MITRRQFLGYSAGMLSAVALAELPKWEGQELDSKLRLSDLREIFQYSIDSDMDHVRYDIKFLIDGKGRWRQYSIDSLLYASDQESNRAQLAHIRQVALNTMQREFDRKKRIRANLLPMAMPRMDTRPEWLKEAA